MIYRLSLIIILITAFSSCKKDISEPELVDPMDRIFYENTLNTKINILEIDNNAILNEDQVYTFFAELQENASLKIVLTNLSSYPDPTIPMATWFYADKLFWDISLYSSTQTFTATPNEKNVADFIMSPAPGKAKIEFYENSDSLITKTVILNWE